MTTERLTKLMKDFHRQYPDNDRAIIEEVKTALVQLSAFHATFKYFGQQIKGVD